MDIIPEAIEDAKYNAKRMGFDNTHYELDGRIFLVGTKKAIEQMQSLWIHPVRVLGRNWSRPYCTMHLKRWSMSLVMYRLWHGFSGFDRGLSGWIHSISGHVSTCKQDRCRELVKKLENEQNEWRNRGNGQCFDVSIPVAQVIDQHRKYWICWWWALNPLTHHAHTVRRKVSLEQGSNLECTPWRRLWKLEANGYEVVGLD